MNCISNIPMFVHGTYCSFRFHLSHPAFPAVPQSWSSGSWTPPRQIWSRSRSQSRPSCRPGRGPKANIEWRWLASINFRRINLRGLRLLNRVAYVRAPMKDVIIRKRTQISHRVVWECGSSVRGAFFQENRILGEGQRPEIARARFIYVELYFTSYKYLMICKYKCC